jgi:uncharacterized repeat protein (TIGR02543 family)
VVPVDNGFYAQGSLVTVDANPGGLVRSGYVFKGWSLFSSATITPMYAVNNDGGGGGFVVVPSVFVMGVSNVVLYAVWAVLCSVTYDGNGQASGVAPVDSNSPYPAGSVVTVLGQGTLSLLHYNFMGWSTSSNSTYQYTPGETFVITEDTVLYADWDYTFPQMYHVTYNKNDSNSNDKVSGSVPFDSNVYQSGSLVTVLGKGNLVRPGYTFLGWHTDPNAVSAKYVAGQTFNIQSNNVVLYAIWSYVGGGSSGSSGSGQVLVGYDECYTDSGSKEKGLLFDGNSPTMLCVESNLHDLARSAVVENLVINGSNGAETGVLLQNVCNCLVRNLTIMNCDVGIRVKLTGSGNCAHGNRFEHIRLINVKTGIVFEGTSGAKDFSYTTIDDVGISLAGNLSDVGIQIGPNANLFSVFVKACVWLNGSNGVGLKMGNGVLRFSLVNLAVEENIGQNSVGMGIVLNSGGVISDNQSFMLVYLGIASNNKIDNSGGGSYSDIKFVPQ